MPVSCCVYGCHSGTAENTRKNFAENRRNPVLFSVSKARHMHWAGAIPVNPVQPARVITTKDKICSLHFRAEDLVCHDLRWDVATGAMPSIFPITDFKHTSPDIFSYSTLLRNLENLEMPENWFHINLGAEKGVMLAKLNGISNIEKKIIITPSSEVKTYLYSKEIFFIKFESINSLIQIMDRMQVCKQLVFLSQNKQDANGFKKTNGFGCVGYVGHSQIASGSDECSLCSKFSKVSANLRHLPKVLPQQRQNMIRRNNRLVKKIADLETNVIDLVNKMSEMNQINYETLPDSIQNLDVSPIEKESMLTLIQISKQKDKRGMRYSQLWLYQCILLRIKNSEMYEYMRKNQIMPLPSLSTISTYVAKLKAHFGFDQKVFELLEEKSKSIPAAQRRGVLLVDEMKVTPHLALNKQTLEVHGFTDLGKYTPKSQEATMGDHGLVIIFQPFAGSWIQPIGAFLSKSAAQGYVLAQILLEAITLMENSGFFVDAIVSDGAQWNRCMWREFGVGDEPWCAHPTTAYNSKEKKGSESKVMETEEEGETKSKIDKTEEKEENLLEVEEKNERKLYFISDFPHLVKCVRNWILSVRTFETPDGNVDLKYWEALASIDYAESGKFGLKACPGLKKKHVAPKHYEKMNVGIAYQFFGYDVATALQFFQKKIPDCQSSVDFIFRFNKLIKAMNSRCQKGALWEGCAEEKTIEEFLKYLQEWDKVAERVYLEKLEKMAENCVQNKTSSPEKESTSAEKESTSTEKESTSTEKESNLQVTQSESEIAVTIASDEELMKEFLSYIADVEKNVANCVQNDGKAEVSRVNEEKKTSKPRKRKAVNEKKCDVENPKKRKSQKTVENKENSDPSKIPLGNSDAVNRLLESNVNDENFDLSRRPLGNLNAVNNCTSKNHETNKAKTKPKKNFITDSSYIGLKATLKATLSLCEFLRKCHGYRYLMTSRLDQNNLEKFFGIIRAHCGTHDHPNALLFIQLYRLLSLFSLVKPPKGNNVGDTKLLEVLLKQEVDPEQKSNVFSSSHRPEKAHLDFMIDRIIDRANDSVESSRAGTYSPKLVNFCGYLAKYHTERTECENCKLSLITTNEEEKKSEIYSLINLRNQFGVLYYPSKNLIETTNVIENSVLKAADKVKSSTIFEIIDDLFDNEEEKLTLLGCKNHCLDFTRHIISFILTVRTHFILKVVNEDCSAKTKNKRKESKY